MRRLAISSVALAGVALIVWSVATSISEQSIRTSYLSASFPAYDLPALVAKAESIAVVRHTGTDRMRWNSGSNTPWTPKPGSGKLPLIYRDDTFELVRQVAGAHLPATLTIRGVGGTVGNDRQVYQGQPEWQKGREYLVMLHHEDMPTETGSEESLIVVWIGHGAFTKASDGWVNEIGFKVAEADLSR